MHWSLRALLQSQWNVPYFLTSIESEDVWDEEDEDDEDEEDEDEDGHHEPEWVQSEREQFQTFRDKNKDGKLDKDEVKDWVIPEDYDQVESETKHLIASSDEDKVSW